MEEEKIEQEVKEEIKQEPKKKVIEKEEELKEERIILETVIKKRHKIIHANLKDDEIELKEVVQARDALKRFVDFLNSKINILENTYLAVGTFFE